MESDGRVAFWKPPHKCMSCWIENDCVFVVQLASLHTNHVGTGKLWTGNICVSG